MNWQEFDVQGGSMQLQAVQHALARYWLLYLQEREYLADIYSGYRTRDIRKTSANPVEDAARLIESSTGKSLAVLDADFTAWFNASSRSLSRDEIIDMQQRLTFLGYSLGKADGLVGIQTRQAVKKFQRDNSLDEDGRVSSALMGFIKSKTGR
tara:strand:- start:380 stop:838 length:459 start_codon:yes stop_codon:yes gene_type:complete